MGSRKGAERSRRALVVRNAEAEVADRSLDSAQLNHLEQEFRRWAEEPLRADIKVSRRRILLIFLLIRYTGGKLNEVLALEPEHDIDFTRPSVNFRNRAADLAAGSREVPISAALSAELASILSGPEFRESPGRAVAIDPAFVRRKFYERALACGFSKRLGSPEMIRKSRGAELMHGSIPLPAVQKLLGHSTPNLTSSYISFSADDVRHITRHFMEKEASRKTSARNCFYGKVQRLRKGDIQAFVEVATIDGNRIATVITNDSAGRLGLREGMLVSAEVKAPWVMLYKGGEKPASTADNLLRGTVERVNTGRITTEYIVRISEQTELCSIVTTGSSRRMELEAGDPVWAVFNSFAVVLHVD